MRFFIYLSFIFITLFSSVSWSEDAVNCWAKHTLYNEGLKSVAFYQFILKGKSGVILVNGNISSDDKKSFISRNIYFRYDSISDGHYIARSYKIVKNPIDSALDDMMEKIHPTFFIKEEQQMPIIIKPLPSGAYIISFVKTPLFYCMKPQ